ncbi:MAG: HNH endonuclease [bacterium]|nr:HNH endonuclease [bacterium]
MRPVNKGKIDIRFENYPDAREHLIKRLGPFCSYCGMQLNTGLAVEHIKPKSLYPTLRNEWDNFLLACGICNSTKGCWDVNQAECLWPHKDNTFLAFVYKAEGRITINETLSSSQREKAQKILDLTGIDRHPGHKKFKKGKHWILHKNTWGEVSRALKRLKKENTESMRESIVAHALARGYWSIWMTIFKKDSDMLNRFIKAFRGTSKACFDKNGKPVPRKGGQV